MKTTTYPTILLLLLLVLCFTPHIKAADDKIPNPPLISITGYGEVKAKPDEVEVSIGVQLRDQSVEMLSELIDTRAKSVIKILKDEGIEDGDIETSNVSIQPYYASTSGTAYDNTAPDYYNGRKTITFTLRNITNYDNIMTQLYSARITSVDSVIFQLSDDLLQEKKLEARKKAAANAKAVLNALVEGLELNIGKAYYVSESTTGGSPQWWI